MRLIDADELYDEIEYDALFSVQTAKDIVELIFSAPTVDAVEVVRCKDCKHYNGTWCLVDDDIDMWKTVELDGFCSNGERRED